MKWQAVASKREKAEQHLVEDEDMGVDEGRRAELSYGLLRGRFHADESNDMALACP